VGGQLPRHRRGGVSVAFLFGSATRWACRSGGAIKGTSVFYGPISGVGGIIVNDLELDTTNAEITIDGDPATPADLVLGMIVAVRGKVDREAGTGDAALISAVPRLFLPVDGDPHRGAGSDGRVRAGGESGDLRDDGTLVASEIEFLSTAQRVSGLNRNR
jgi:hypothetical protein